MTPIRYVVSAQHIRDIEVHEIFETNDFEEAARFLKEQMADDPEMDWEFSIRRDKQVIKAK